MTLVLGTLIASDVLDDSAVVVQDVLAFLDDFDRSSGNDSAATDRQSEGSVTDSLGVEENDRQIAGIDPVKLSRRRARAEASNRARVQRYQRKKGELHALRRQVASLVGRVALLQQCARSSRPRRLASRSVERSGRQLVALAGSDAPMSSERCASARIRPTPS